MIKIINQWGDAQRGVKGSHFNVPGKHPNIYTDLSIKFKTV